MTFRFLELKLTQFRCFEHLELALEENITVIPSGNEEGTTILTALAMGIAPFQAGAPSSLRLNKKRDARKISENEQAKTCSITWTAEIGGDPVVWSSSVRSGRKILDHDAAYAAFEQMRTPGVRWPLFAFYGRMSRGTPTLLVKGIPDRCEGYLSSLDSAKTDTALLTWMLEEFLADSVRRQNNEPEQGLVAEVLEIAVRAAPYLKGMWYDPRERSPVVRFVSGEVLAWSDLPDGYHSHLSLIIDIARRAMMLNGQDGGLAPSKIEGVVLIDEISLRLHPRCQRVVLDGLREIFPCLQFVVTTPENEPLEASPKVA